MNIRETVIPPGQELDIMKTFFYWFLLVSSDTVAQMLLKMGAIRLPSSGVRINSLIVIGYSFYILSFIAWMQILKYTKLSIALTTASVLYITVTIGSYYFLGEVITSKILIGTILIATGIFIINFGNKGKEEK